MKADLAAVREFLRRFFSGTQDQIEIRALPVKGRCFTRTHGEVRRFIQRHAGQNLHFGAVIRNGGGTKRHRRSISALWVDADFKTIPVSDRARLNAQGFCPRREGK